MHSADDLVDFTRFYEAEAQPLIRSVALATGRPGMAEDAVAEAFARAWLRWPDLRRDVRSPAGWIMHVALNECRGRFRRLSTERRKAHVVARPDAATDPEPFAAPVWAAVADLSERERSLIALRYLADLTQEEIAQALGLPVGTVASGLSRARQRLGVALGPTFEETSHG